VGRVWRSANPAQPDDDAGSGDARLVEGLRRGTPAAFAGLHERYATGIYNLALRVVRHGPDAEDITQDVLIRAFERLPQDREVLLSPWLYRLTLNRCYDYLRRSARRPLPVATGADLPSPQDPYDQSELQRLLEAAIGDLTRRQRAALLLKDVHGLSLVEIAACLDLTPGSVEVLLARARRSFRARYEERCLAAGRPSPRSSGGLAALPLLPLPTGLAAPAPPLPFVAPAHVPPAAALCPPLTVAAGSGIGAALGLPASLKTAVLIAAAAATVGTAEIAVTQADHRPPRSAGGAAALVVEAPVVAAPTIAASASPRAEATPFHAPSPSPSSSEAPSPVPEPSPAPTQVAEPTPEGSPLAIATPTASPEPSVMPTSADTPTPAATPTAHATPPPDPSPDASPAASLTPGASPSPVPTP
jgi:RNA polymerase sigma factor (sigma-70 family)